MTSYSFCCSSRIISALCKTLLSTKKEVFNFLDFTSFFVRISMHFWWRLIWNFTALLLRCDSSFASCRKDVVLCLYTLSSNFVATRSFIVGCCILFILENAIPEQINMFGIVHNKMFAVALNWRSLFSSSTN